jgi:glycosyltransferase involved in cell wall biosynthesis
MAELTYLIAAFNGEKSIERTIRSIIEQPGTTSKVIVVDDGSSDETPNLVRGFRGQVTLLQQSNAGPSAARNTGLEAVDTEIVCFVDQDDYVIGPHCESVRKSWEGNADIVIGLAAAESQEGILLHSDNKFIPYPSNNALLRRFIDDDVVQTSTFRWSTAFLKKIGGWDNSLFGVEDIELAMRAFLHNPRVVLSNTPGWVVWRDYSHPKAWRRSRELLLRCASSQAAAHAKLIKLMEEANCDGETIRLFLRRCMTVGRMLYLQGFYEEAVELFTVASSRGYTELCGPRIERILAKCLGIEMTLSTRNLIGKAKRRVRQQLADLLSRNGE